MRLKTITGRARKCGPSALSAITGEKTEVCAQEIRGITGKQQVHGVSMRVMSWAVVLLGLIPHFVVVHQETPESEQWLPDMELLPDGESFISANYTLASFLDRKPDGYWLIVVRKHFIAYANGQVADSGHMFSRKPQDWTKDSPHRRVRVVAALQIKT